MATFLYVMDPMCSWCWAFTPAIKALKSRYPEYSWQYIMGGLAPDSDKPMPAEMQDKISSIWKHIETKTGTEFNHDFWARNTPRRSTYPACRAVISAEILRNGASEDMARAIQKAYYLDAQNPSDISTLTCAAERLGFDKTDFETQLNSDSTQQELEKHLFYSQQLGAQGFPSLFILHEEKIRAISYGYCTSEEILLRADQAIGKE